MSVKPDAPVGYIVECDLEYPEHLHDRNNDYPLAPEHMTVSSSSSSSSQNPAESTAHNASVPDELWAQRDQPALEDIK